MSVKSQQVAKPQTANNAPVSPVVASRVRGFAGNHTLMRKQRETSDETQRPALSQGKGQSLQRKCACGGSGGQCEACEEREAGRLQRTVQTKLAVNEVGDRYEQEADRVADQMLAAPAHSAVSGPAQRIQRYSGQATGQAETAPASVDRVLAMTPQGQTSRWTVNAPGDLYEHEADRVADAVFRVPGSQPQTEFSMSTLSILPGKQLRLQPQDIFQVPEDEEDKVNKRVQRKASAGVPQITPALAADLNQLQSSGQPIPPRARAQFDDRLGYDFSGVRIHADSRGDQMARALHAQAFTWGRHIAFREGAYAPNTPVGQHLLAHELIHTIQQRAVEPRIGREGQSHRVTLHVSTTLQPLIQKKDCNFFVFDSTEDGAIGTAWDYGAAARALAVRGGYAIGSSDTIEYMLTRLLEKFSDEGCDCIEEIQFWSHGSPGNAMSIKKTDDEITAADFNIPGLEAFGYIPKLEDMVNYPEYYQAWAKWFDKLTWRQQLLVEVRQWICGSDAEIYYRSCEAFQGKSGQEFAKASAQFWRSKVVGHTKIIGLTRPGEKTLKPGEEPYWSETEGTGETEYKKRSLKSTTKPKKD